MGSQIGIESSVIESTALFLDSINRDIGSESSTMQNNVNNLRGSWSGAASTAALDRMNRIFEGETQRKKVLENYSTILHVQINPSYERAEDANHSLADNFK